MKSFPLIAMIELARIIDCRPVARCVPPRSTNSFVPMAHAIMSVA
jgi:hypothetical protein